MSDETKAPPPISRGTVIGLGELLWDVFPAPDGGTTRRPGGAPANVAFQCHQLGLTGRVASRVGDDADGRELTAFLADRGLPTDLVQTDGELPTGTVTVSHGADGPEYMIHEPVAWDAIEPTDALRDACRSAAAVCYGTLARRNPQSREAIREVLPKAWPGPLRVCDVNLRQDFFDRDSLRDAIGSATALKLNDAELPAVAELCGLPPNPDLFLAAATQWEWPCVPLAVVTRGADGCLIREAGGKTVEIPADPVAVADTVGAGDAFTAGLIFALLRGADAATCGRFANAVGGLVASRDGAMPELRGEFAALRADVFGERGA